jgi:hypothetical protein
MVSAIDITQDEYVYGTYDIRQMEGADENKRDDC